MASENPEWRCFFCDEVFTRREDAAEHFGSFDAHDADEPACKLMRHQKEFMKYVRGLEEEIRLYQDENQPLQKAIQLVEYEMATKEREAEERGYNKGVQDMTKQGMCPEPEKHQ